MPPQLLRPEVRHSVAGAHSPVTPALGPGDFRRRHRAEAVMCRWPPARNRPGRLSTPLTAPGRAPGRERTRRPRPRARARARPKVRTEAEQDARTVSTRSRPGRLSTPPPTPAAAQGQGRAPEPGKQQPGVAGCADCRHQKSTGPTSYSAATGRRPTMASTEAADHDEAPVRTAHHAPCRRQKSAGPTSHATNRPRPRPRDRGEHRGRASNSQGQRGARTTDTRSRPGRLPTPTPPPPLRGRSGCSSP